MEKAEQTNKFQRTTPEQLECYLSFVREHPEFRRNKNDPTNPKRMEDLWKTLSAKLNSLKGPTRTPKKWKESLQHWKNQLRSRARKAKASRIATGGGPLETDDLNSFEQRAVDTFGSLAVDGLNSLPMLGIDEVEVDVSDPQYISCSVAASSPTPEETNMNSPDPITGRRKMPKGSGWQEKIYGEVLDMMHCREQRDAGFQKEFLKQQTQIMEQQKLLIEAFKYVADALKCLAPRQ